MGAMQRLPEIGERFADFVMPDADGQPTRLYARVGGRPVCVLIGVDADRVAAFEAFSDRCDVVAVCDAAVDAERATVFVDAEGTLISEETDGAAVVLDGNLRVVATVNSVDEAGTWVDTLAGGDGRVITHQAPVLTVGRLLDADRCAFLTNLWEHAGAVETGVEQTVVGGRKEVVGGKLKSRRDHTVTDEKLTRLLTQTIGRRLIPEVERAFNYRPTRFEGYKIACYDAASSGFFHAHRDNLSPNTAHRRLAVSLNLNDDFEGGELRFPEFGADRYRPPAGGAVVFACAHLHEVLPVTSGRRFALLTFLYDEARKPTVDPFAV